MPVGDPTGMNNISNYLKVIQVVVNDLRIDDRYIFHENGKAPAPLESFVATVRKLYNVIGDNDKYILLTDRVLLKNGRTISSDMTIPSNWLQASVLDIPCLPEEIGRLIQQY
jgi:hypothetical protein